jgi:DNA repair protein RecO (recombination protein O)
MGKTFSDEALVLRAFDLGEADRLYVLLTAHHGRLAVRAGGARKPLSRLGGHLAALSHVRIQCAETAAGIRLTSALAEPMPPVRPTAGELCAAGEMVELLLRLTEEETPLPGLFELFKHYIEGGDWQGRQPLFAARLLHLLGHLPVEPGAPELRGLSLESQSLLFESLANSGTETTVPASATREIGALLERVIEPLLARPLKAQVVRLSIAAEPRRHLAA